jgi:hypothetical protein
MDPLTPFFSAVNNTKKLIDYGFQLKGVSEESRNAQEVLRVIQHDLNELKRLATELEDTISTDEQRNIDDIVCQTNGVIALIAAPNRRSRKDVTEHGTVTIYRRIMWTLRDGDTIKMYYGRLLACQSSLNGQLTALRTKQALNVALSRGTHGSRLNAWEDKASLAPGKCCNL